MARYFNLGSAALGIIAAGFWFWSATVRMPTGFDADQAPAFKKISILNGIAAALTGLSVLAQAIAQFLG